MQIVILLVLLAGSASAVFAQSPTPAAPPAHKPAIAKIGILAYRGTSPAKQRWQPLLKYLDRTIPGWSFQIVPVTLASAPRQIKDRKIDFLITNPGHFVALQKSFSLSALATRERLGQGAGRGNLEFGSVVFVHRDSEIQSFSDLRHKTLAAVSPDAFGGFQIAWREFSHQGLDPFRDLGSIRFLGFPQDAIVSQVADGKVDAGVVRSGLLELLAAEGQVNLSRFRVLNGNSQFDYPYLISSRLYPEWPFAALPSTDRRLREQMVMALIGTQTPGVVGQYRLKDIWSAPLSYNDVRTLISSYNRRNTPGALADGGLFAARGWNFLAIFLSVTALALLAYVFVTRSKRQQPVTSAGITSAPDSELPEILLRFDDLTKREREVLCMICQGFSSKVVADKLGISVKTVEYHRSNLLQKTRAGTTPRLVQMATRAGFDQIRKIAGY
jgi:two-component system sensor histidine kinase TtrS